jgi:hypothetical protein
MKKIGKLKIEDVAALANSNNLCMWNEFFLPLYIACYDLLPNNLPSVVPQIDYDTLKTGNTGFNGLDSIIKSFTESEKNQIRSCAKRLTSAQDWKDDGSKAAFTIFLNVFPVFSHLTKNINIKKDLAIKAAEIDLGFEVDITNFIEFKRYLGRINHDRWSRTKTLSEQQGGKSILGATSELLLQLAFGSLIDGTNLFKVTNQKVSSYGDFILMCLPNNLWLSVKSNFARERLLASGYTTDIIGVGFFEQKTEFTSTAKIRNFQRVGFLAMYIPDAPVTEEQYLKGTNTYNQVIEVYSNKNQKPPKNINGSEFIRPLSDIAKDMENLLKQKDITKRVVLDF